MLKERAKFVCFTVYFMDIIATIISFFISYYLRRDYITGTKLADFSLYVNLLGLIIPLWTLSFYLCGIYASARTKSIFSELKKIILSVAVSFLILNSFIYFTGLMFVSRTFLALFLLINILFLSAGRIIIRTIARYARKSGYNCRYIIVVGTGRRAREIIRNISQHKQWGLKLYGVVNDQQRHVADCAGIKVVGMLDDLFEILHNNPIDEVVFAVSRKKLEELVPYISYLEEIGVRSRIAINFFPKMISKIHLDELNGIPFLTFSTTPYNEFSLFAKRMFDVIIVGITLFLLSPLFLMVCTLIKLTSDGPVFFRQRRVGLNGRMFTLLKFRSMVAQAEEMKSDLLHLNEISGPAFKIQNDPRITFLGKFLRKTSFDEIPQLLNVLRGDMSLVGPRPPIPDEVQKYKGWHRRRLSMKPGITGLWQVSGRNNIADFDNWIHLDLQYIDNWSLTLDFKILFRTFPAVLLGKGAA